jgi:catechol 2,3-dioxygenase-like lactoylglutathione lyase family enzyme
MRSVGVADAARSSVFYRDVLGFAITEQASAVEAVNGPARIRFGTDDYPHANRDAPRPRGSAILFFETDDVAAMHASIVARGGSPSEIEKVNRVKMRMFEVRDPDGHTLWFGQSYHVPDGPGTPQLLRKALPSMPVDDVPAAVAHYRDVLGFRLNYQQHDLGVMDRDARDPAADRPHRAAQGYRLRLRLRREFRRLYAELKARGADIRSRPWGLREFLVSDPDATRSPSISRSSDASAAGLRLHWYR